MACYNSVRQCTATGWICVTPDCAGTAPFCRGDNSASCCQQDPGPEATCQNGSWTCGGYPPPGCNGVSCELAAQCGSAAPDGGERYGMCSGTDKCCGGGAVGTFYCYGGDGGCPPVP